MFEFLAQFPWAHLALKIACGVAVYEGTLLYSRRLDRRGGHKEGFGDVLDKIRTAPSPGLGIYYGCRELGRCVFAAGAMYIT